MKKRLLAFLPILLLFASCNRHSNTDNTIPRPKLVIGIVIDQMRWDYLYRYYDEYANNGFKRLINNGYNCQNNFINYIPAFTGPGHACIFTGSVPSIHGIAGNDWYDNLTGKKVYCTDDSTVKTVGDTNRLGLMSPKNMLVTTISDELKLATNFRSKVYGFSLKDRASILPAGHLANGAFWYNDSNGKFITSTYYMPKLPSWMEDFNKKNLADSFLRKGWDLGPKGKKYHHSNPDNSPYEGAFKGEVVPVFPYKTAGAVGQDYNVLRRMPAGNTIVFEAVKACMEGENLGNNAATDFLTINIASTDYAGHQFGPNALELEDIYVKLDEELGNFLSYLDRKVGKGNYLFFLTADHGSAHNAQFMLDNKIPAGFVDKLSQTDFNVFMHSKNMDSAISAANNYQIYFDETYIKKRKINRDSLKITATNYLKSRPEVAYVIDMEHMENTPLPEPLKTMVINGYHRNHSGALQIIYNPAWYASGEKTGTTHGTWQPYDTHIPLLWYGWHVKHGEQYCKSHMTDIAATVAAMLHVQMPNGCIGSVIEGVVR